ncbi:hypothetical protein NOR_01626 [Metarhizium rileyi]|uniref:Uncharacterized protein n=1 Tax=Metarhizium rileyi (strain RCEF 4871) TaxID=1649241 RepID=A0A167HVL3_METRR|nr:hypothetical protein NOR_01626 [Metarhizium rileyi RCEF 4871]
MLAPQILLLLAANLAVAYTLENSATCGEGLQRICYGVSGGMSQDLDPEDVQYVADYLRYLSDQNEGAAKFWNMPKSIDCAEWGLPVPSGLTVLALAKHVDPRIDSSILYEDLAAAIDGGLDGPVRDQEKLVGCGKNGGQIGVQADLANSLYYTKEYNESKAKPEGIIIKLVHAPLA